MHEFDSVLTMCFMECNAVSQVWHSFDVLTLFQPWRRRNTLATSCEFIPQHWSYRLSMQGAEWKTKKKMWPLYNILFKLCRRIVVRSIFVSCYWLVFIFQSSSFPSNTLNIRSFLLVVICTIDRSTYPRKVSYTKKTYK